MSLCAYHSEENSKMLGYGNSCLEGHWTVFDYLIFLMYVVPVPITCSLDMLSRAFWSAKVSGRVKRHIYACECDPCIFPSKYVNVTYGDEGDPSLGINTTDGKLWRFFLQSQPFGNLYCENYTPTQATAPGWTNALILDLDADKVHPGFKVFVLIFNSQSTLNLLSGDHETFGSKMVLVPIVTTKPEDNHVKAVHVGRKGIHLLSIQITRRICLQISISFGEHTKLSSENRSCYSKHENNLGFLFAR